MELQPNTIAITLPSLFQRKEGGDTIGAQVTVEFKVTFPDGQVVEHKETIQGKSTAPYTRTVEIKHPSLMKP